MTWELDDLPERYRRQVEALLDRPKPAAAEPALSERQWQAKVVAEAKARGWWCHHIHDSRRSEPGWPDLTLIRPPRILFAELKAEDGTLRREQPHVMGLLRGCGLDVHVWRPSQFAEVLRVLA